MIRIILFIFLLLPNLILAQSEAKAVSNKLLGNQTKMLTMPISEDGDDLHFLYPDDFKVMPKSSGTEIIGLSKSLYSNFSIKVFSEKLSTNQSSLHDFILIGENNIKKLLPQNHELIKFKDGFFISGYIKSSFVDYILKTTINHLDNNTNVSIYIRRYNFVYKGYFSGISFTYVHATNDVEKLRKAFEEYLPSISYIINTVSVH